MLREIPYDEKRLHGLHLHHRATRCGYVSVKIPGIMYEYAGRFGEGIAVVSNNPSSTQYCNITYYVR